MKARKRILSLMLAVFMVFSMVPLTVSAAGIESPAKGQVYQPGKTVEIKINTEYFQECEEGKNYVEVRVYAQTKDLAGWVFEDDIPYTAKGKTVKTSLSSEREGNYRIYYSYYYLVNGFKKYIEGSRNMYISLDNSNQTIWASGVTNFQIQKSVLKLDKSSLTLVCGKSATLKASFDGAKSTVEWKSTNKSVATVDSSGKVSAKQAGTAVIQAVANGQTVECKVQVLYKDVTNSKDFWYTPTNYLTEKGVVKGYANQTEFRPANKCTRAQMVTFIWRLQGEPKPKASTCKFKDVKKTDYFYKACIWGNENHIVEGYKDGTFGPQIVCARKHAVTFLWRLAGQPKPSSTKNKFSDVKTSDYFYKATLWASEKKILAGYDDGTFRPNGDCLRRQMVTFLYKYDKYAGSNSGNKTTEKKVLNIWSFNEEVPSMVSSYMKAHPDVAKNYDVKTKIQSNDDGKYQDLLDKALKNGGTNAPDIYAAEEAFVLKYTQGSEAKYAAAYKDLGIDVKTGISKAKIAQYTVDIGTRPSDSNVVGLGFQSTGGAFIYRRSIAKKVFGTDDPAKIAKEVGPGWDKFMSAAKKLKDKGYVICSGIDDVWHAIAGGSEKGWVGKDGKLVIDSDREEFLDIAKQLVDNGYTNDTHQWSPEWNQDMAGQGDKECFGFLGPAWLINYTMGENCGSWVDTGKTDKYGNPVKKLDKSIGTYGDWAVCTPPVGFFWGGTWVMANKNTKNKDVVADIIKYITLDYSKDGAQYAWANGLLNDTGTKDAVASATVMGKSDGKCDFLGGQNMYDIFIPASDYATGKNKCEFDDGINAYWCDQVWQYAHGEKSRAQAITDFKNVVKDDFGI